MVKFHWVQTGFTSRLDCGSLEYHKESPDWICPLVYGEVPLDPNWICHLLFGALALYPDWIWLQTGLVTRSNAKLKVVPDWICHLLCGAVPLNPYWMCRLLYDALALDPDWIYIQTGLIAWSIISIKSRLDLTHSSW